MKLKLAFLAAIFLAGCSMTQTKTIWSEDGKTKLGQLATYQTTADFGGWLYGGVIYGPDGKFLSHEAAAAPGILPAIAQGAAIANAGHAFPKEVNNNALSNSQAQGQSQYQHQSQSVTVPEPKKGW
jgi:hypothetical protein